MTEAQLKADIEAKLLQLVIGGQPLYSTPKAWDGILDRMKPIVEEAIAKNVEAGVWKLTVTPADASRQVERWAPLLTVSAQELRDQDLDIRALAIEAHVRKQLYLEVADMQLALLDMGYTSEQALYLAGRPDSREELLP